MNTIGRHHVVRRHSHLVGGLAALLVTSCIAVALVPCTAANAAALAANSSSMASSIPTIDVVCLASFQFDFSPPLNFNTVTSQTTATLTSCLSPNGTRPGLLSAVLFAARGHSSATGCSPFPLSITGVGSIMWNNNSTSTFTFAVNTDPLAPTFGLAANITAGTLAGDRITAVPAVITQEGICLLGGVNSLSINFGADVFTH